MCTGLHVKHRQYCQILMKLEFSLQIFDNAQISNLTKISAAGTELFRAERGTDMTRLIVVFRNFANAPKNCSNKN